MTNIPVRKNAFGYMEFPNIETYENFQSEYDRTLKDYNKTVKEYNSLVEEYNTLLKNSKSDLNKSNKEFQRQLDTVVERKKQIKSLISEINELQDQIADLKTRTLDDFELELKNCKTVEEIQAVKLKHKTINIHRRMVKTTQKRMEGSHAE